MPIKRSELIDTENAGYYHLISRCVRRTFLCGTHLNLETNIKQSYDHRRAWIEKRILDFADVFAIEVYAFVNSQITAVRSAIFQPN
jgi:REP-associated tyrosine transposase